MSASSPSIQTVVETSLYGNDLTAMEAFYSTVLGLPLMTRDPHRHLFYQVGPATMLLIFKPDVTLIPQDFPAHGSAGPGHVALGIAADQLEVWRQRLSEHQIEIEREITWPRGGHSLYFRDPAGNSIELITPGVWGLPAGW